jgi:predicted nuclease of predicted toxin-antitoxin system
VKLFDRKLLADENIHPDVVRFLRQQGCDVRDIHELGLAGQGDDAVLAAAYHDRRIVLTHDGDFARVAISQAVPIDGIAYLRPGHINPTFTIASLQAIQNQDLDLSASFVIVAFQRGSHVRIRLRRW